MKVHNPMNKPPVPEKKQQQNVVFRITTTTTLPIDDFYDLDDSVPQFDGTTSEDFINYVNKHIIGNKNLFYTNWLDFISEWDIMYTFEDMDLDVTLVTVEK